MQSQLSGCMLHYICNQEQVFVLSVRSGSCLHVCHGYVRQRLSLLVPLSLKTLFSVFIRSITDVDSALMLHLQSAFSTDCRQLSIPQKLQ